MRTHRAALRSLPVVLALSLAACDEGATPAGDGGLPGLDPTSDLQQFRVRVENVSNLGPLPTPLSPGVWYVHDGATRYLVPGQSDQALGLEALAEDGDPTEFLQTLRDATGIAAGTFPVEGGLLMPGEATEFTFSARPGWRLDLATMFVESNDVLLATESPIRLFDADDEPVPVRLVSRELALWDLGTEVSDAPGFGIDQAPRQAGPNAGQPEGGVRLSRRATRALPFASDLVRVDVGWAGDQLIVSFRNISDASSVARSPFSPVVWALHDGDVALFAPGARATGGIERMAEEGNPAPLLAQLAKAPGIGAFGVADVPARERVRRPVAPGGLYRFAVTPTEDAAWLSFASMLAQSNDVFVAPAPRGVRLLDEDGVKRHPALIEDDLRRSLALWDAGTERNEVPGAGLFQAPRQGAPDSGPADPDPLVRRYADGTNDLAGPLAGGFVDVQVELGDAPGAYEITVTNASHETGFPGVLTPVLFVLHDGDAQLFRIGEQAPTGLEALAEDGDAEAWVPALTEDPNVIVSLDTTSGPLQAGDGATAELTPTLDQPFLNLFSMVVPSNDTFVALGPIGVPLLTAEGAPRDVDAIEADIRQQLQAWDAGTEADQASALGPDMAPFQLAADTGAPESAGLVHAVELELWPYPILDDLVKVWVAPIR